MKLSIVVCSYNQGCYIGEALQSLTTQVGICPGELELIVMDGGSTDGTLDVISRYRGFLDVVVSAPDGGQSDALDKGFRRATGEIFGWLCSDDVLEPNAVREVLDYFDAHPEAKFVYGDTMLIAADGRLLDVKREIDWNWFIWLHTHNYIPQPSAFWRRELYFSTGGLKTDLEVCMDSDLFCRFAMATTPQHFRQVWSRARMYPEVKTHRLRAACDAQQDALRQKCGVRYRSWIERALYYCSAMALRTWLKLRHNCYGDSAWPQIRRLLEPTRWLEVFGLWHRGC
jgi:glycosyltransferase involved in cell wall biosynthesis